MLAELLNDWFVTAHGTYHNWILWVLLKAFDFCYRLFYFILSHSLHIFSKIGIFVVVVISVKCYFQCHPNYAHRFLCKHLCANIFLNCQIPAVFVFVYVVCIFNVFVSKMHFQTATSWIFTIFLVTAVNIHVHSIIQNYCSVNLLKFFIKWIHDFQRNVCGNVWFVCAFQDKHWIINNVY